MSLLVAAVIILAAGAALSALLSRYGRSAAALVIGALAAAGAAGAWLALRVLWGEAVGELIRPWLIPGASFHLGLDPLSSCFLLLIMLVGCCAGIYGEGYIAASRGHVPAAPARFFFLVLVASMALLVGARNALLFMAAWETMALAAFGLVSCEHGKPEVRKAGLLYLLCTHVGSLCLLALFALLGRNAGSLEFDAFAAAPALPAAVLAIVGAFAVVTFSKFYGLGLLGQPRSKAAREAKDPSWLMLGPMALLAALCIGIGVFPAPALYASIAAAGNVCRAARPVVSGSFDEWSRLLGAVGLLGAGVWALSALLWIYRDMLLSGRKVAHGPTWGCGFTAPTARMQYSGSSYPVPTARVFTALIGTQEDFHPPLGYWPAKASFESRTPDPALERWLPVLVAKFNEWLAVPRQLQRGRLQSYLLYMSAFLVAILLWKL